MRFMTQTSDGRPSSALSSWAATRLSPSVMQDTALLQSLEVVGELLSRVLVVEMVHARARLCVCGAVQLAF